MGLTGNSHLLPIAGATIKDVIGANLLSINTKHQHTKGKHTGNMNMNLYTFTTHIYIYVYLA